MSVYLTVDLGTTGCRSLLLNERLEQIGESYREYSLILGNDRYVEQDAKLWWLLTLETAEEAILQAGIAGAEVNGISISSQGITMVPVNKSMKPLCNAISWLDTRAESQTDKLKRQIGMERIGFLTGKRLDTIYTLPKLLWLKENMPDIYKETWKILMPMDFLIGKLTGICVTDHSMASGTLMYDIRKGCWSKEILSACQIQEDILPDLKWSGEPVGYVLPEIAEKLGLRSDCVVAVGAQDQKCALLGAGIRAGVMTVSIGTAGAVCRLWDAPYTKEVIRVGWSAYVSRGTWVTEGVVNTAGTCLRWVRDTLFAGEDYDLLNQEAEIARKRGSGLLFYPYLNGPVCPDYYSGSEGCFYGVSLYTKRGDFALAVMEGVAFQVRILLEEMQAYGNVHTLILFGGGAKSPLWCQIFADVTGMCIKVLRTVEAAGAGAAILAGIGTGEFDRKKAPSVLQAAEYTPGEYQKAYQRKYQKFRQVEKRLWSSEE